MFDACYPPPTCVHPSDYRNDKEMIPNMILKVKQDRYGASNVVQKFLNLTLIPAIGLTLKLNHSHTNKINLTIRFSESFANLSRPSVRPLTRDTWHASVGKKSKI